MQMNITIANHVNMRIENNTDNSLQTQRHKNTITLNNNSVFGPQCKVTISREGRKLSEQSSAEEAERFTAGSAERLLLREQRQSEQSRDEQSDTLKEISGLMAEIKNCYAAGEDKETIAEKQEALNRLFELKARQEEENEQRVKDAESSAAGASREQEEIDQKNADLYLMLKTLEEKDENEQDSGDSGAEEEKAGTDGAKERAGDQFQQSADMLGASAAKRELQATGMIEGMFESGYGRLAEADAMMREVRAELDLAVEALAKENLSEAERDQLMAEHVERAGAMMNANYGEMMNLRRKGHQEIRDAQEVSLKHIAVSPLDDVGAAKQAIMDAGVTAAFHEVSQGTLDKASEELEERVQEAIDKRNDITDTPKEDEEQAKAELDKAAEEDEALEEKRMEQEAKAPEEKMP